MKKRIILASNSPRRKELFTQVGIEFQAIPSKKEEYITKSIPSEVVQELSYQKAEEVACSIQEEAIVIGADTIVAVDEKILGKPKNEQEAKEMIQMLQGRKHQVCTGVSVIIKSMAKGNTATKFLKKEIQFVETTEVVVEKMTENEIDTYIATKEPMDKAGAYGIQGFFALYVKEIHGDYNNVVGFPIARFYKELKKNGVTLD